MMEKTLILKHISRMLCLLISYSKFTLPNIIFKLTFYFFQHILTVAKECGEIPSGKVKALRVAALRAFLLVTVSCSVWAVAV